MPVLRQVDERVALMELERKVGLREKVHTDDVEAGPVIPHCSSTATCKKIKEAGTAIGPTA
jgi:hypothetical protein